MFYEFLTFIINTISLLNYCYLEVPSSVNRFTNLLLTGFSQFQIHEDVSPVISGPAIGNQQLSNKIYESRVFEGRWKTIDFNSDL